MLLQPPKLAYDLQREHLPAWGGARPHSGRRAKGPIASERHGVRPACSPHHPVHVIARVAPGLAMRGRAAHICIARAVHRSLARSDFRIVAVGVRAHAIELIVEADDRVSLARGIQGFEVAAAKHWNRLTARRGGVFADRYRARALVTRLSVRAALAALPSPQRRAAWPESYLLQLRLAHSSPGVFGVGGDTDSSGIRYSSPSHRPRSTS